MFGDFLPPGEVRRQVGRPGGIAGVGDLRAFGVSHSGVDGITAANGALDLLRLVFEQGFMDAAPMGEVRHEPKLGPFGEESHRGRDAEQGAAAVGLVADGQAGFGGEGGGMVEEGKVLLDGEVIGAGVRVEVERPERQGPLVLRLEGGHVLGGCGAAGAPLLGDDRETELIECLAGAVAGFQVEGNVQFDPVKAALLDLGKAVFEGGQVIEAPDGAEIEDLHRLVTSGGW